MAKTDNKERLFEEDGLHLSANGYELWKKLLKEQFLDKFIG
jgi:lysophospholipase L1-like esterase